MSGSPNCQPAVNLGAGGRSAGSPSAAPASDHCRIKRDLVVGEPALVGEVPRARLGLPGRHLSARRHLGDQPGALGGVAIAQQRERGDLTRPVAGGAPLEQDRGDVLVERDLLRLPGRNLPGMTGRGGGGQQEDCKESGHGPVRSGTMDHHVRPRSNYSGFGRRVSRHSASRLASSSRVARPRSRTTLRGRSGITPTTTARWPISSRTGLPALLIEGSKNEGVHGLDDTPEVAEAEERVFPFQLDNFRASKDLNSQIGAEEVGVVRRGAVEGMEDP